MARWVAIFPCRFPQERVAPSDDRYVAKEQSVNGNEGRSMSTLATLGDVAKPVHPGVGIAVRTSGTRRRPRILIVGDQTETLERCARRLASCGYRVDVAHDQATLARLSEEREFDVVVNDIDMRNCCDGQSLRELRRQNQRVPVVVLSECLGFASARAALDCGAHKYLVKPVSEERLLQVLVDAVRDASALVH